MLRLYIGVIGFAARLGPEQIIRVVQEFDPICGENVAGEVPQLRNALTVLETMPSVTSESLDCMRTSSGW